MAMRWCVHRAVKIIKQEVMNCQAKEKERSKDQSRNIDALIKSRKDLPHIPQIYNRTPKEISTMLFRSLAVATAIACAPAALAFAPNLHSTIRSSALRVATPITPPSDLITKEANIKPTKRTNPTIDPFNPEFARIQNVPYSDAFPNSTKEYKTAIHEPTGHELKVPFRRVHLEDEDMEYLDLYDTSGARDIDPRDGLPKVRF